MEKFQMHFLEKKDTFKANYKTKKKIPTVFLNC